MIFCNIPVEYLLKILQQLVKANILKSKRGPRGGFSMAKKPTQISMLNIVEAVEGPHTTQSFITQHAGKNKFNNRAEKAFNKALDQAKTVLHRTRLADLMK